jgi:ethanolamine utilization protein EutA (predicted chaperonin)
MNPSRRTFLQTTLGTVIASHGLRAQTASAGRKLRIAGIGIGGMGRSNLNNMAS